MVWTLNPWQTLLWIVALEVVSLPLIVGAISSIIDRYYKSKEAHSARIMKAIAGTIDEVTKKIKEDGKKIKNKLGNPFSSSITKEDIERAFDELGYKKKSAATTSEDKNDDSYEYIKTILDRDDDSSPDKPKNLKDLLGIKDNSEWTATIIDHRDDKEE